MVTDKKVWFITGAGRGLGAALARAVLADGDAVVATGRDRESVSRALGGDRGDLLVAQLDITVAEQASSGVANALERFGRIDVLVNNAGSFAGGYFEELTPEQVHKQLVTGLLGPMNVTRAILPQMRAQRSGHIMSISSSAGLVGFEYWSAYAAAKFGLEGWMQSLQVEVEPFGIATTIISPGSFRTDFLEATEASQVATPIADYAERRTLQHAMYRTKAGHQPGDPAKLARALIWLVSLARPPRRFVAGADSVDLALHQAARLHAEVMAFHELSTSLALEESG